MENDPKSPPPPPQQPSLPWRIGAAMVTGFVGSTSRLFMFGANRTEVHGLDKFLEMLDRRKDPEGRERGLITVSNHTCVIDDPLIWGVLPFKYHINPNNLRWGLAAHDICFTNKFFSTFFILGQTLPTYRLAHSPLGGLFQPTMTQAVRLLSRPYFPSPTTSPSPSQTTPDITDPFISPTNTYTYHPPTPTPSTYPTRRYSWIHIFPEGKVHQHPHKQMRYFKWGVARLILEPDVCPDIVPMWIEGNDQIMHESRGWPRFLPRVGKRCGVWFGENIGGGADEEEGNIFNELRGRWRELVERDRVNEEEGKEVVMGVLSEGLKYGKEAIALREECTLQVRRAVLEVRRQRGLEDEDEKAGFVETWRVEGGKREGKMGDGSWVKDV